MSFISGFVIGVIITLIILKIRHYLKDNGLVMNWPNLFIILSVILVCSWLIYSFVGMIVGPINSKSNGNICQGYKYGLKHCWGDINAE